MNTLTDILETRREKLFSIFFTAGYPSLDSTSKILFSLQENGVDFVEVGMPYSDPLADGPVIQHTNTAAIANGMQMQMLFSQLKKTKGHLTMPVVLMGYLNPVLQFGMEAFCREAREAGVSGVILPDLPLFEYEEHYADLFRANNLHMIFLVTPTTKPEKIMEIDRLSTAFIYAVSTSATTGTPSQGEALEARDRKIQYLQKLKQMNLTHPVLVGFGINDPDSLSDAWSHASGAIVGTAYLNQLSRADDETNAIGLLKEKLGII